MSAPTTKALTTDAERAKERAAEMDRAIAFGASGVQLATLEDAGRFAMWARESGLTKAKNNAEVVIALQIGMELGFSPMQALQVVHVIDGKPTLAVEAQAARVESAEGLEPGTKIQFRYEGEGDDLACIVWSTPRGGQRVESAPVYLRDFKHLRTKDNWQKYPQRMLKARAVGWHVRDFYAAHVRNLPTSEEMGDVRAMRGEPPIEREINPPPGRDPLFEKAEEPEDVEVSVPEEVDPETGQVIPADLPR